MSRSGLDMSTSGSVHAGCPENLAKATGMRKDKESCFALYSFGNGLFPFGRLFHQAGVSAERLAGSGCEVMMFQAYQSDADSGGDDSPVGRGRRLARLLAGILFALGVAGIIGALLGYRNVVASPNWPTTEGLVIESRVVGIGGARAGSGMRARVRYVYDVEGFRYKGRRITYQRERGDRSEEHARKLAKRYSVGSVVPVYYRPDRPNIAVLEPGGGRYPVAGSIMLAVFFLGGAVLIWVRPIPNN